MLCFHSPSGHSHVSSNCFVLHILNCWFVCHRIFITTARLQYLRVMWLWMWWWIRPWIWWPYLPMGFTTIWLVVRPLNSTMARYTKLFHLYSQAVQGYYDNSPSYNIPVFLCIIGLVVNSMDQCKKDITSLLTHWITSFLHSPIKLWYLQHNCVGDNHSWPPSQQYMPGLLRLLKHHSPMATLTGDLVHHSPMQAPR